MRKSNQTDILLSRTLVRGKRGCNIPASKRRVLISPWWFIRNRTSLPSLDTSIPLACYWHAFASNGSINTCGLSIIASISHGLTLSVSRTTSAHYFSSTGGFSIRIFPWDRFLVHHKISLVAQFLSPLQWVNSIQLQQKAMLSESGYDQRDSWKSDSSCRTKSVRRSSFVIEAAPPPGCVFRAYRADRCRREIAVEFVASGSAAQRYEGRNQTLCSDPNSGWKAVRTKIWSYNIEREWEQNCVHTMLHKQAKVNIPTHATSLTDWLINRTNPAAQSANTSLQFAFQTWILNENTNSSICNTSYMAAIKYKSHPTVHV